jgi:hypothetical protein
MFVVSRSLTTSSYSCWWKGFTVVTLDLTGGVCAVFCALTCLAGADPTRQGVAVEWRPSRLHEPKGGRDICR